MHVGEAGKGFRTILSKIGLSKGGEEALKQTWVEEKMVQDAGLWDVNSVQED